MTPMSFSCVVDASVAAQLYVPEPLTSQAVALFAMLTQANAAFHVPDLFYAECANIFWKKVQRAICTPAESTKALSNILALPLRSTSALDLAGDALSLALAQGISAALGCAPYYGRSKARAKTGAGGTAGNLAGRLEPTPADTVKGVREVECHSRT